MEKMHITDRIKKYLRSEKMNGIDIKSPALIRYGDLNRDEFFVPYPTANAGVTIKNTGYEPLVMLKFFGPDCNPDMPDKR